MANHRTFFIISHVESWTSSSSRSVDYLGRLANSRSNETAMQIPHFPQTQPQQSDRSSWATPVRQRRPSTTTLLLKMMKSAREISNSLRTTPP